ncbi:MAG: GNAT family N-acetyltransferase [Candidatus Bathyarchaeia archaeon]|jgi:GNAT superfamily N-acetyltransferase
MDATDAEKQKIAITQMTQQEVYTAVNWARQEGWNPGIHDAESFYHADPKGFYAAKINNEIVGTLSIVKYTKDYAFVGFLIVRPDMRGKGIGTTLFNFLEESCKSFNAGLDGVLGMQTKYELLGFRLAHKNYRYSGVANGKLSNLCMPISKKDFNKIVAYDAKCFSTTRLEFLSYWLFQKDGHSFMVQNKDTDEICGYGVIRKCFKGHKIGPLFAGTQEIATAILESLMSTVNGEAVFLDVPEPNRSAVELAQRYGMQPVFATVRMYTRLLQLPLENIYGLTSFELG